MTARYNMTLRRLALTAVCVLAVPASLAAQVPFGSSVNRAPDKNASQIMITAFKSTEKGAKGIGFEAAEEMRKQVEDAFSSKQVYVIPIERINPNLVASNFDTTEALEPHDAKQLATYLRADEYVAGAVKRLPAGGYQVQADLVLTRDLAFRQPLGVVESPKLNDALKALAREMKEARKQLDGEKKCTDAARDGKYPEAIQFAKEGIAAYPKATLARMCLMSVLYAAKAPSAEITKVAHELTELDPRSNVGFKYLADAYRTANESDSLVVTLLHMMQNDPRNSELQFDAITEIASAKNPGIARPIIDSAVVINPGDPDLLKLRWQILAAMKDYPEMMKQGMELVRLDTSFADTTYFIRTSVAYATDSMWQQAAQTAAQGVAKFPNSATLVGLEVQQLRSAGQSQQALDKLDRAMASKVAVAQGGTLRLLLLKDLNRGDDIVATARQLIAEGDTTENVRLLVIDQANQTFAASQKLIPTDPAAADSGFTKALSILTFADSVAKPSQKPQVAFLKGASSVLLATLRAQAAQASKSCELTSVARGLATEAMISLPQGGASAPKAAMDQLMDMAIQLDSNLQQMAAAYKCK